MTIYEAVRRRNAIRAALACRLADIHVAEEDTQTPLAKTILLNSIALLTPDQLATMSKVSIDFGAVLGFVLDVVRAKYPALGLAIDLILDSLGIGTATTTTAATKDTESNDLASESATN